MVQQKQTRVFTSLLHQHSRVRGTKIVPITLDLKKRGLAVPAFALRQRRKGEYRLILNADYF